MTAVQPTVAPAVTAHRLTVLSLLLVVAAAGWAFFLSQAVGDEMSMGGDAMSTLSSDSGGMAMGGGDAMSMGGDRTATAGGGDGTATAGSGEVAAPAAVPDLSMGGAALPFLVSWVAMMAGMMLPAAAPMILLYARTQRGRPGNVALFTGSYLLLWAVLGVAAFAVAVAVERLVEGSDTAARLWPRAAGALIVVAGLYQFSDLKERCLRACRSPLGFILTSWRAGAGGAVRMGVHHGLFCAGCCWLLFLVLVPIGLMDVAAMALVAVAVFAEKVLPWPVAARRVTAVALLAYGAGVVLRPELLPTVS